MKIHHFAGKSLDQIHHFDENLSKEIHYFGNFGSTDQCNQLYFPCLLVNGYFDTLLVNFPSFQIIILSILYFTYFSHETLSICCIIVMPAYAALW